MMIKGKWGEERKIPTADKLMEIALGYFQWVADNPLYKHELIKSGDLAGIVIKVPIGRPYSWSGLEIFAFNSGFNTRLDEYKYNRRGDYNDFIEVISKIEKVIYTQKFDGATTNLFNATIISRDLGLAEKTVTEIKDTTDVIDYDQLSESALQEIQAARKLKDD